VRSFRGCTEAESLFSYVLTLRLVKAGAVQVVLVDTGA
jgi:hypothetical protein